MCLRRTGQRRARWVFWAGQPPFSWPRRAWLLGAPPRPWGPCLSCCRRRHHQSRQTRRCRRRSRKSRIHRTRRRRRRGRRRRGGGRRRRGEGPGRRRGEERRGEERRGEERREERCCERREGLGRARPTATARALFGLLIRAIPSLVQWRDQPESAWERGRGVKWSRPGRGEAERRAGTHAAPRLSPLFAPWRPRPRSRRPPGRSRSPTCCAQSPSLRAVRVWGTELLRCAAVFFVCVFLSSREWQRAGVSHQSKECV